ncbi:arginase [Palleronia marisminoris]|uniref:Arginase n=1 Tax=Palleronia marisminoris TaxID=315423 RepID=A0A1Y5TCA1_9RHOB|nr:arginase [Palleronia marisminoris]SFH33511.1 arginase [Palleronia marisminoris]SLN60480.1 Arginase [Palleronia marisminoris]
MTEITLIGVPLDSGQTRPGCLMGPDAYRVAGIVPTLTGLGHTVRDIGNVSHGPVPEMPGPAHLVRPGEVAAWTEALIDAGRSVEGMPVFMGGDHALALGSVAGMAARAADRDRPLFVLWLDAHSDFHTPLTTESGNLHGTPVAYYTGQDGFEGFPPLPGPPVPFDNLCMMGLRSVDPGERDRLAATDAQLHDMRAIDETGFAAPLRDFLAKVAAAGEADLHVSLDVDFLDPSIAPAVGTTVPGGATFREAHLVMEMLSESELVTSLDLVELNPAMDERSRTARLMVELTASLMGKRIFDRPTRGFGYGVGRTGG